MTNATPDFVRNRNDEDNTIIRVAETPRDYMSIHGIQYLEARAEEGEDDEWDTLYEKFLQAGTETTLDLVYKNQVKTENYGFPDAVAYRIEGDPAEYTKEEILSHINSWDPSFSGYTYWDGNNWCFQYTADELGEWSPVVIEFEEVAEGIYLGTETREGNLGEFTTLCGFYESATEHEYTPTSINQVMAATHSQRFAKDWIKEAIEAHLSHPEDLAAYEQATRLNPFGGESLEALIEHLNEVRNWTGKKPTTLHKLTVKFLKRQADQK